LQRVEIREREVRFAGVEIEEDGMAMAKGAALDVLAGDANIEPFKNIDWGCAEMLAFGTLAARRVQCSHHRPGRRARHL